MRMRGTNQLPRLVVRRSEKNFFVQVMDDTCNKSLFSLSTLDKEIRQKFPICANLKAAEYFGQVFAQRAKEKGIEKIIFDRAGYLYHGRIKTFAEALRKGGLQF